MEGIIESRALVFAAGDLEVIDPARGKVLD
jgi:hypothetical protein